MSGALCCGGEVPSGVLKRLSLPLGTRRVGAGDGRASDIVARQVLWRGMCCIHPGRIHQTSVRPSEQALDKGGSRQESEPAGAWQQAATPHYAVTLGS
jgi:hypothetical protein